MIMKSDRAKIWYSQLDAADNLNLHEFICQIDLAAGKGNRIDENIPVVVPWADSLVRNRNIRHHEIISIDGA